MLTLTLAPAVFGAEPPVDAQSGEGQLNHSTSSEPLVQETLKGQIEARARELERINEELERTQKSLDTTKGERVSLQNELQRLEYATNQLKLNIRADEVSISKLGLELRALSFDISDIESATKSKRSAIVQVFRLLQRSSDVSPLIVFLRNESLADGVLEAQALSDLNTQLAVDIGSLRTLQGELAEKLDDASVKKDAVTRHRKNLENRTSIVQDQTRTRQVLLTETKSKESEYAKQVAELQKLQQEIAEEIESLDAELRTKIDPSLLPAARPGVLALPVDPPLVTQKYGSTKFAQTAYPGKWHNGTDFRAPLGTPIVAAESGRVAAVGDQDSFKGCYRGAYGKFIVINHNNNLTTLYAHLSRQAVRVGEEVTRGQLIGYSGSTGYATGAHLHFTVFAQPTFYMGPSRVCGTMPFGGDLNPERYL
ncbi:MAG: peptidoglycan DD-metalloendopeptidase family protein [Candidatus Liptonbacteria bacterium]|nr:peptidoglycan DD-metalloendopeptidase family protein [Candidatus Liptonbacteria bacterium]